MAIIFNARTFLIFIILGAIGYTGFNYYSVRGRLVSQSHIRSSHLVVHDISMLMDQTNKMLELCNEYAVPASDVSKRILTIRQNLNQLWRETRQMYKSPVQDQSLGRTLSKIEGFKLELDSQAQILSNQNDRFRRQWLTEDNKYQTFYKKVILTEQNFKSVTELKNRYQENIILKFFLEPVGSTH